jgi:DNA-binding CsgD family transcriptional regulator
MARGSNQSEHEAGLYDAEALGTLPFRALRPNRVYSLSELLDLDNPAKREEQQVRLNDAGIGDGMFIKITGKAGLSMWLVLLDDKPKFEAVDGALLLDLVPAVSSALAIYSAVYTMNLRLSAAEQSLAMLGMSQAVLDRDGAILACDDRPEHRLDVFRQLAILGAPTDPMRRACAGLSDADTTWRELVHIETAGGLDVVIRPIEHFDELPPHPAAAIAVCRAARSENPANAAKFLKRSYGLSGKESLMALAISRGSTIIEAGALAGLTSETARNYSKRIYAKTGARGQADLVRILLGGLMPLS